MMKFNIINFIKIFSIFIGNLAFGFDANQQINSYLDVLSATTIMAPLEGAGSHGSLGIGIGAGAGIYKVSEDRELIRDQLRDRDSIKEEPSNSYPDTLVVPKLFFHKGFAIPVDVGGYLSKIPDTDATSAGIYTQWTFFEAFAMPAFATRVKYAKLMGLPSSEFQSMGAELVGSYGILSIFNIYASIGQNRESSLIRTSGETGTSLSLTASNEDFKRTQSRINRSYGIQVQILPLYCTATIENQSLGTEQNSWVAKVSMGI